MALKQMHDRYDGLTSSSRLQLPGEQIGRLLHGAPEQPITFNGSGRFLGVYVDGDYDWHLYAIRVSHTAPSAPSWDWID